MVIRVMDVAYGIFTRMYAQIRVYCVPVHAHKYSFVSHEPLMLECGYKVA